MGKANIKQTVIIAPVNKPVPFPNNPKRLLTEPTEVLITDDNWGAYWIRKLRDKRRGPEIKIVDSKTKKDKTK